jgi:ketosteroid isomerase-like protein
MSTLTDDAVALAPGFPVVSGGDLESWISKTFFDPFYIEFSTEDVEVEIFGDLGYVRGHYKQALTPKQGGDKIQIIGKYLCIVKRQKDGSWRFSHLAWNSDSV